MQRIPLAILLFTLALAGCGGLSKLDYSRIYGRAGWQLPDRVVESLKLQPGDRVADLGAGNGYFLPYLVEAVGPTGRVYAVEVDDEAIEVLEKWITEGSYANVIVVRAEYDDPLLPDGEIDLVFLCNTYHHIEERIDYFSRLREDLAEGGRVAIVDPNAELRGILRVFLDEGHTMSVAQMTEEMETAGYRRLQTFDFLATQIFGIFSPDGGTR